MAYLGAPPAPKSTALDDNVVETADIQNGAVTADKLASPLTTITANTVKASGTSSSEGRVELYEDTDNGTNYVALKAPASIASDLTLTLPSADGTSGQALTTNGSGVLAFSTIGTNLDTQTFNSSGTWTKPAGCTFVQVILWGAGGGGGRSSAGGAGGGGGGGAMASKVFFASDLGSTETVTIATGGAGGTAANTAGSVGGNSTFGSLLTAYGGGGGLSGATAAGIGGGGGGATSAGSGVTPGGPRVVVFNTNIIDNGYVGGQGRNANGDYYNGSFFTYGPAGINNTIYEGGGGGGSGNASSGPADPAGDQQWAGGGGGGAVDLTGTSTPGTSVYGGGGGAGGVNGANGTNGTQPAGGGGGSENTATAGAGGAGKCIVYSW